jgi:tRNA pseudouridine38-40 synthase
MCGETEARSGGRRIAVELEYDGTAYCGSQYQDNGPSIQQELETAIRELTGQAVRAAFAGRTDAGVHALAQVAAFDLDARIGCQDLVRGLNHFLPPDIAVRRGVDVGAGFDPRRDARSRLYRYRIDTRPVRSPFERDRAWHVGRALDVSAMRAAAMKLLGEHDFAAFAGPYDGSTRRTLRRCDICEGGGLVTVEMESQSFLPHQVRRMVGPLTEVGLGRVAETALTRWLDEANPSSAGPAAPACGLYLVGIEYGEFEFGTGA